MGEVRGPAVARAGEPMVWTTVGDVSRRILLTAEGGPAVFIRAMRENDVEEVARLSGQLGYPTTPARVAQRLALIGGLPDNALFVAEDEGGGLVGWVHVYGEHLLEAVASHAEIGGLVVDEGARRRGIGGALMRAAEDWAAEGGYGEVRVRSGSSRTGAHTFYQRAGYEVVKTQIRFRKSLLP